MFRLYLQLINGERCRLGNVVLLIKEQEECSLIDFSCSVRVRWRRMWHRMSASLIKIVVFQKISNSVPKCCISQRFRDLGQNKKNVRVAIITFLKIVFVSRNIVIFRNFNDCIRGKNTATRLTRLGIVSTPGIGICRISSRSTAIAIQYTEPGRLWCGTSGRIFKRSNSWFEYDILPYKVRTRDEIPFLFEFAIANCAPMDYLLLYLGWLF